jgi:hypothetical protein
MPHPSKARVLCCLIPCALALLGCGRSTGLNTAPVTGAVTLDGKPLTSGFVRFSPADGGRGATGTIHEDGTYKLKNYTGEDGAPVGKHRVAVVAYQSAGGEESKLTYAVPERYANFDGSGLEFEVVAGQDNRFDIPLTARD